MPAASADARLRPRGGNRLVVPRVSFADAARNGGNGGGRKWRAAILAVLAVLVATVVAGSEEEGGLGRDPAFGVGSFVYDGGGVFVFVVSPFKRCSQTKQVSFT